MTKETIADVPKDQSERYVVNFKNELREIIRETKYLDRLGLQVPNSALNIALQEDKYFEYVEQLSLMLKSYHAILDELNSAEKKLLMEQIQELKRVMKPGFSRLNWNSLGIPDFISRCTIVSSIVM